MGQARKKMAMMAQNGHVLQQARTKPVRVVADLKLENRDGVTFLMIGEEQPELAIALSPEHCRILSDSLIRHAEANEREVPPDDQPPPERLIVLPGE